MTIIHSSQYNNYPPLIPVLHLSSIGPSIMAISTGQSATGLFHWSQSHGYPLLPVLQLCPLVPEPQVSTSTGPRAPGFPHCNSYPPLVPVAQGSTSVMAISTVPSATGSSAGFSATVNLYWSQYHGYSPLVPVPQLLPSGSNVMDIPHWSQCLIFSPLVPVPQLLPSGSSATAIFWSQCHGYPPLVPVPQLCPSSSSATAIIWSQCHGYPPLVPVPQLRPSSSSATAIFWSQCHGYPPLVPVSQLRPSSSCATATFWSQCHGYPPLVPVPQLCPSSSSATAIFWSQCHGYPPLVPVPQLCPSSSSATAIFWSHCHGYPPLVPVPQLYPQLYCHCASFNIWCNAVVSPCSEIICFFSSCDWRKVANENSKYQSRLYY
ncbi:uncharacterized protein [Dendrobates tinctorius]|uniref:uncharacterized protein isoform X1 n=1 Tax=Dendrobates tinctorius TaxID=92724 RepID=UPI003CC9BD05